MTLEDCRKQAKLMSLISQRAHYVESYRNSYRVTSDPLSLSTVVFVAPFNAAPSEASY